MASTSGTSSNDKAFKCQCRLKREFLNCPTIRCDRCKFYEHIVCLGHRELSSLPRPHYCFDCKLAADMERDKFIKDLSPDDRARFCGVRMYLYANMTQQVTNWVKGMPFNYVGHLKLYLWSRGFSLKNFASDALLASRLYPLHFYLDGNRRRVDIRNMTFYF